jgi:hypothetical protein
MKKTRKSAEKNAENNGNETSGLLTNDQYFETNHIGRI